LLKQIVDAKVSLRAAEFNLQCAIDNGEGGENGCNIGWMKYQIQQAHFNKDKVYIDNFESLCTIKRWRGIEL
jgi:hypothetical protein